MDGITLKVSGSFKGAFDEISKEMPNVEKRALYKAAYFLRDCIRRSLVSSLPKATEKNPKYIDTLVDAVGFSKVDGASTVINAMGNRQKGSGTYRTRFFEEGTVERYQKKRNGIKLKRKKYIGRIKPYKFFESAVRANESAAVKLMQDVIGEYVDTAFKNTN